MYSTISLMIFFQISGVFLYKPHCTYVNYLLSIKIIKKLYSKSLNEAELSKELTSKAKLIILSSKCPESELPNKTYEFTINLEKNKYNSHSMTVFYMNIKTEIIKINDLFEFFVNGKKQTKNQINKKYQHIKIDHLDKDVNLIIYNYFHLNWTKKNIINMDFKDEKLVNNLCGMCEKQIENAHIIRYKRSILKKHFMSKCNSQNDCDKSKGLNCIINECKCAPGHFYQYNVNPKNAKCQKFLEVNQICLANFQCNAQKGLICTEGFCQTKKIFTKF